MKHLKHALATISLVGILSVGTVFADGIIINGAAADSKVKRTQPCTTTTRRVDWGIIINGLTGIIINGFTGIIINGASGNTQQNCGIIING